MNDDTKLIKLKPGTLYLSKSDNLCMITEVYDFKSYSGYNFDSDKYFKRISVVNFLNHAKVLSDWIIQN